MDNKKPKLEIEDVVSIKRHLAGFEGKLKQKEIAELFGVALSVINNIKGERLHKAIQIDEAGIYIEPKPPSMFKEEPLPEFIVPHIERVKEVVEAPVVVLTEEERVLAMKKKFLDELWTLKPIWLTYKKGNYRSTRVESTNVWFTIALRSHWSKKYKPHRRISLEEFIAQSILIVQQTVLKMDMNGEFTWEKALEGDESSLNILFDYLLKAVKQEMKIYERVFSEIQTHTETEIIDGKKEVYKFYTGKGNTSTDTIIKSDEGETTLLNLLNADQGLYGSNYGKIGDEDAGKLSHFTEFFEKNKRLFLTPRAYENWEIIVSTKHVQKGGGYTKNDRESVYGVTPSQVTDTTNRVKDRAIRAYSEAYPNLVKEDDTESVISRISQRKNAEIQLLQQFMAIIEDENIALLDMNKKLSEFILCRLDKSSFIFDLIYENLSGFDLMNVNDGLKTGEIFTETLYLIVELVEAKLISLEKFNTVVIPFRNLSLNPVERKKRKKHTSLQLTTYGNSYET